MTAHLEISLLPDPERFVLARGYRVEADKNHLLYAQTGTTFYRDLADCADRRADAMERGVSLLFDLEATCST